MPNVKLGNDTLNGVNTVRLQKADGGGYEAFVANPPAGADGKSAYQIAVDNGFTGTETEWIASLHAANPKVLPISQYATETEAVAYMDSQSDHSAIYVWNNKLYCYASRTVSQLNGACLYGYRNSASSGVVTAAGKSMYVIPVSTFAAPLHVEDYKYPISDTPYIYGGTAIPTFDKTLISEDNWVGKIDAFDITEAQLQNCTYIAFSVTTESQPTSASITVNGTVIPLNVITSPSQIKSAIETGTTVSGYVNSGVDYTTVIAQSSCQKYLDDRNVYIAAAPNGYCEVKQTNYENGLYLTMYSLSDMNNKFSALVSEFPDYITEYILGKDQTNTYDIKYYVFDEPIQMASGHTSVMSEEKPTIILTAGVHGMEKDAVHTAWHFAHELCHSNRLSEFWGYLRNNIRFVILPIANPWAYVTSVSLDTATYYNSRGVNINNNFEYGWSAGDHKGSSPNSEAETQRMITLFNTYPNAVAQIELHGQYAQNSEYNKQYWFSLMKSLKSQLIEVVANNIVNTMGNRLLELGYETGGSEGGYISYYGLGGRPKDYTGSKYGMLSFTLEGTSSIPIWTNGTKTGWDTYDKAQKLNCEALANTILELLHQLTINSSKDFITESDDARARRVESIVDTLHSTVQMVVTYDNDSTETFTLWKN